VTWQRPGQTVTLTATVTDPAGDNLSGGAVGFYMNPGQNDVYAASSEPLCTKAELTYVPATHDNAATCSFTPESSQTDQLFREYSGYGEYAESTSAAYLTVS
jgi:Bacterial Ig-like domain (group 3)